MHWFPFYSSDFLGATVGLSCLERALYALMLPLYYEVGPFPPECIRVYRIIGCESDEQKRAIDYLLERYFVLRDDGWYQERAEEVKVQQAQIHDEAVHRGKLSAAARTEKYGTAQPQKPDRNAFETLSKRSGNALESVPKESPKGARTNQNHIQNHKPEPNPNPEAPVVVPDWLPIQSWKDWLDHRGASHGKFTRKAQKLAIKTLDQLRLQGNDPVAVIENSIASGYKGLFAPKPNGKPKGQPGMDEWLRNQELCDQENSNDSER